MSVPRNMLKELLERKLWPIALVLVIALVAVPVLLTKKAPTDIVTPPTGPLPYSSGTTLPAISVQTSPGSSNLAGKGRNPFTPQHVATTSTITTTIPTITTPTTGASTGTTSVGSGSSSSTGSGSSGTTTARDAPPRLSADPDHARADDEAQAGADRADGDRVLSRVARAHRGQRQPEHDRPARAAQHPAGQAAADAHRARRAPGRQERGVRGRAGHRGQRRRGLHPGSDRLRDHHAQPWPDRGHLQADQHAARLRSRCSR